MSDTPAPLNRANTIISNILTLIESDMSEAGKSFDSFKNDTANKNTDNYDSDVHKEAMHMTGDTSRFTKPEKTAISMWTDPSGYKAMNGHLRGNNVNPSVQKHVANLDSAMDKTNLSEETHGYRGIHGPHQDNFEKLKPGDTFFNKGYTATTVDPRRATHYARNGGSMMHITVPKGGKGLYVSHPDLNSHTSEREMLLPHHTHFQYSHSEQVTVPEHHYDGTPTGKTKTLTVHHVTALSHAHDMSSQLDKA